MMDFSLEEAISVVDDINSQQERDGMPGLTVYLQVITGANSVGIYLGNYLLWGDDEGVDEDESLFDCVCRELEDFATAANWLLDSAKDTKVKR